MRIFVKSVLAGICISIGGTTYLMCDSKIVGSILFSIGLLVVLVNDLNLFTGKVGYLTDKGFKYLKDLLIILIGNFIGTFITSFLLSNTRIFSTIKEHADTIVNIKLNDSMLSIFILSIFCGILMYIAVNNYKTIKDSGKYISIFLCVPVFILSCFEHCIANMYYFSLTSSFSIHVLIYLLIMILGNSVGAILYSFSLKYIKN